jgi:hypothetical protein
MTTHMLLTETDAPCPSGEDKYPARWIRVPTRGHCPHAGLSRAAYYELIKDGKIRSASVRRPGALRGMRLVWLPSVMAYLDRFATGGASK